MLGDTGFETVQLLREQLRGRSASDLHEVCIVLQNSDENRFIEQLSKLEFNISESEKATK